MDDQTTPTTESVLTTPTDASKRSYVRKLWWLALPLTLIPLLLILVTLAGFFLISRHHTNQVIQAIQQLQPSAAGSAQLAGPVTATAGAPFLGSADAKVTIIEFADFQCPFCKEFFTSVFPELKRQYIDTGKVRFVFQHFPFLGEESIMAAEATACAQEQDRFWPYHDLLYERQEGENQGVFTPDRLKQFAGELGLDRAAFDSCLDSHVTRPQLQEQLQAGQRYGVTGTPTVFVNNQKVEGVGSFSDLARIIDQLLEQ
jgi:protein-disulfide isomerase